MIAMALSCNPKLLIADEPTTALDVTIQAQILDLLAEMKSRFGMAIMLITHDLGVVAETAQRVAVMYAGRVVEEATVERLFAAPLHPYTQGLIRSIPRIDQRRRHAGAARGDPRHGAEPDRPAAGLPLRATLPARQAGLHRCRAGAAHGRSRPQGRAASCIEPTRNERAAAARQRTGEALPGQGRRAAPRRRSGPRGRRRQLRDRRRRDARPGRRIGLRQVHHRPLHPAADRTDRPARSGSRAATSSSSTTASSRALRRDMQIIFQDPYASLNPRMTVGAIIGEALIIHGLAKNRRAFEDRVVELLETVGLNADHMRPLSARVLRRPAPAHRHRARARGVAEADRVRRAGLGARRLDPGAGDQPARGPAGAVRPDLPVHRPRPVGGASTSATASR